jgi:hypothetical protein
VLHRSFEWRRPVAWAIACSVLIVACGGPERLSRVETEEAVADALAPVAGPGVRQVVCPEEIALGEGVEVRCRAELAEGLGSLQAVVTQIDDEGTVVVAPDAVVVVVAEVEDELGDLLRRELDRTARVECGRRDHRLVDVGATFPCRVTDGDERRSVDVTVEDGAGTRSFRVAAKGN